MDKAQKLRKVFRSSFTRQHKIVLKHLEDSEFEDAKAAFKLLERDWQKLQENDEERFNGMLDDENVSEEDIEKELAINKEYDFKFERVKIQVMETYASVEPVGLRNDEVKSNVSNFGDCTYSKLNLPPIKIEQFDGEIKNWLPFWGQFEQIHLDESIPTFHKFRILLQSLKEGTRAKQVADSFPIYKGNENYDAAICALKERFGREDLLIEVYIRELLGIIINNKQSQLSVIDMYDKLECHLRFLEILGITTGKCAAILCPLLESCMSEEFLRTWQRSYNSDEVKDAEQRLTKFREFIKTEVQSEQRITLAVSKFGIADEKSNNRPRGKREYESKVSPKVGLPTAMGLFTGQEAKQKTNCIFCNQSHNSVDCFKARDMSYEDKLQYVRDAKCCYICLKRFHMSKQCKNKSTCTLCSRRHAVIICPNYSHNKHVPSDKSRTVTDVNAGRDDQKPVTNVTTSLTCDSSVILPTVQVSVKGSDGQHYTTRAVFDTAAQRSYILNTTAEKANCKVLGRETLHHSLFGGNRLKSSVHIKYDVQMKSLNGNHSFNIEALGQDVICGILPTVPSGPWVKHMIKVGIPVDNVLNDTGTIELLIGADFAASLFTGRIEKIPNSSLVCIETYLGWTISGKVPNLPNRVTAGMLTTNMLVNNMNSSDLWRLDLIGIEEPTTQLNKEQLYSEVNQHFLDTVTINEDGRYEVSLPWKQDHTVLPSNYEIANKRLKTTCNKLNKDECYELYETVFNEWVTEGVIEEVIGEPSDGHFLPHRHVIKLNSSTAVRPVFDASAHEKGCPSLNDCLHTGCNLIKQLTSLLNRFRLQKIGVVADIRRAFLQISINPADRRFLRFLWYDAAGKTIVYQHKRVVFGLTSSPFLLAAVIQYHLQRTRDKANKGDSPYSLSTIDYLKGCFYVDNVVVSLDSQDEVNTFMNEATSVMAEGKFDLRAWEYTDPECETTSLTPVLGLNWNRREDTLSINTTNFDFAVDKITKRDIMSAAHRVFDPIGIVSPVTVCPKLLLKELWEMKLDWDDEVPDHIKTQFINWVKELKYLEDIKVPRWLGFSDVRNVSVHTFTDASENSYAAAVFVRIETQYGVKVQLVHSKTRVSPVKKITIPRLELLAATIGSRLFNSVRDLFPENCTVCFWTDSTTVIAWLKRNEHWAVFVANRVKEISKLTPIDHWNHVPGVKNPADLPSRGCLGRKLVDIRWWEGPDWLYLPEEEWPKHSIEYNEKHISEEKRKTTVSMVNKSMSSDWYYKYFSNYEKLIRMFAWVTRFVKNCRTKHNNDFIKETGVLSTEEIRLAEENVCKLVQQESFLGVKDPSIATLEPFEDQRGVIRLRTKISNRSDSLDFRFPILLPKSHPVVTRLIRSIHENECHVGVKGLLAILRERFWIIGGRQTLKSVVTTCVTCKRYDSRRIETPATPLPVDRVRDAAAFEVVGVDLTGPVYLKDGQKAWICLFTCAVVRAIHLELVQSLSTEDFLMALRRFIARRGRPVRIYSDQGTNFIGCANLFQKIEWDAVIKYCNLKRISWKFNPPTAAWWGGWWERLIGITKRLLRRVIKKSVLTYQEMETVLCDCESVVNSRPLTYISEGDSEPTSITPSLFIQDIRESGMPELEVIECTDLRKKLQHRAKVKQDFRERFRSEYLGLLQSRTKNVKNRDIKIGDIVMIGNDNSKRMDWPMGRVIGAFPGKDGKTRLVRVKTATGECMRPVQRLYPLLENDVEIKCLQKRLVK